jgi:FAD/FMN-containing dehydrogenase
MIYNFGRNVKFEPKHYYIPHTEAEILDILNRHKNGKVRVRGSFHAWNGGVQSEDVLINVDFVDQIKLVEENDVTYAIVGGGCKLESLVKFLESKNLAVPTMGGIMKQTVGGLASTATHGSGRSSFSHYLSEVRIAAYDSLTGKAKIYEYKDGDELRAARTAIGCMGVIVSVKMKVIPRFWVTEHLRKYQTLDEILALENEWPLTQFGLIPHNWSFVAFQRQTTHNEPNAWEKIRAFMVRIRDYVFIEVFPHVLLKLFLMFRNSNNLVKWYYDFLPRLLLNVNVTNLDYKGLTLHIRHHYQFRHLEMEIFVPEEHIREVVSTIRALTKQFADEGKYVHHYIFFFRKVLSDDTLISMTAGNKAYYSIGVFTYHEEDDRTPFYEFAKVLATVMNQKYNARLHWGKYIPLNHVDIAKLYPEMDKFKSICKKVDPNGVFQNDFTQKVLGN